LKRISRKQILDVDVAKACQTIVEPVAPMALRLQGNLLYGVSRVYLQQCGYVLSDAENAHNAMRTMLRTVKNLALDPDAGKAR
jgi:meiotic recombination protein REC8